MLSVGLHCRLAGRPGRAAALARFLDYVRGHERVWVARRIDIARHWVRHHRPAGLRPSRMSRAIFVEIFGDVFEHSPGLAESAHAAGLDKTSETAEGLHGAFVQALRALDREGRLALVRAHPDLAGRLAVAEMTADSQVEQSSAGLDRLTPGERDRFLALNDRYKAKFGFPFVMAVKGRSKDEIIAAFAERLGHEPEAELERALSEIERIALLRLKERLP
jgi:OHCU decarboxylase